MRRIDEAEGRKQKGKKKRKAAVLVVLLILLILVTGAGIRKYIRVEKQEGIQRELDAELGILPGMKEEEIQDRLNRKVAESRLNVSMNPTPVFADGSAEGNVRIENIEGNNYAFAVKIEVIGTNEEEEAKKYIGKTILTTGVIDPGMYLEKKKLDEKLPKGTYVCVASFTAYDVESLTEIGVAGMQIVITVEA